QSRKRPVALIPNKRANMRLEAHDVAIDAHRSLRVANRQTDTRANDVGWRSICGERRWLDELDEVAIRILDENRAAFRRTEGPLNGRCSGCHHRGCRLIT